MRRQVAFLIMGHMTPRGLKNTGTFYRYVSGTSARCNRRIWPIVNISHQLKADYI